MNIADEGIARPSGLGRFVGQGGREDGDGLIVLGLYALIVLAADARVRRLVAGIVIVDLATTAEDSVGQGGRDAAVIARVR